MKKLLVLFAAALMPISVWAQQTQTFDKETLDKETLPMENSTTENSTKENSTTENSAKCKVAYQGEVIAGFAVDLMSPIPQFDIQTIQGIRVGEYFSTGIGVGLDVSFYPSFVVPIFLNFRGYLPVSQKTKLFLGLDTGVAISSMAAFYVAPAFGANFKLPKKGAINVSLAYKSYIVDKYSRFPGGLAIRVGYVF